MFGNSNISKYFAVVLNEVNKKYINFHIRNYFSHEYPIYLLSECY